MAKRIELTNIPDKWLTEITNTIGELPDVITFNIEAIPMEYKEEVMTLLSCCIHLYVFTMAPDEIVGKFIKTVNKETFELEAQRKKDGNDV